MFCGLHHSCYSERLLQSARSVQIRKYCMYICADEPVDKDRSRNGQYRASVSVLQHPLATDSTTGYTERYINHSSVVFIA